MAEGPENTGFDGATTLPCPAKAPGAGDEPCLVVVGAPAAADIGRVLVVDRGERILGRSDDADLRLDDPGVSRRHARVVRGRRGGCTVVDLRSTNGTYVNGVRVRSATLQEGDRVRIGSATALRFSRHGRLDESEERLRQSLAAAGLGTWEWDARTGAIHLCEVATRLLRLDDGAPGAAPRDGWAAFHPEDRGHLEDGLARVAAAGSPFELECRVVGAGGPRWVALRGELLRDEASLPVRVAGVVMDVTDRRRREEELSRQARVLASLYDGVLVLDGAGAVVDCNASAERMLGFEKAEAVGGPPGAIVRDGWPASLGADVREAIAREGRFCAVLDLRRRDGGELTAEVVAVPLLGPDGDAADVVALLRDVTGRKRVESRLLVSDRLASLGTLAAGLAHEINNPLALVSASLVHALGALAEEPAGGAPPADLAGSLRDAQEGAARIAAIVRDLTSFARGDATPHETPVDLARTVALVLRMAANELRHRCRVRVDVDGAPPVAGGEPRVAQVLLNLVVNAAQAIPEGAAADNEVSISARGVDGAVEIEVRDTGAGIAPAHLGRVFDPFFTTRPVGSGSGLGLAICHGIVASLGGEISVESAPGKGARFRVRLPAASGAAIPAAPPAPPRADPARRLRLLVVDDEPLVATALQRVLSRNHEVTALVSGEEALGLLARDPAFDAIVCDVMMPDVDGPELHERLLARAPGLARRVVFVSGGAFTARSREFLERVPNPCVGKPIDLAELERALAAVSDPLA